MNGPVPLRIVRRAAPPMAPQGWSSDVHPVLQQVYATRGVSCPEEAGHRLDGLLPPTALGGLGPATELLAEAIRSDARILVAGDYDCDGATGCAVAVRGLHRLGARNVGYVVPDRAIHGYGLTPALVDSLSQVPDLIVTVDNGITSLAGVAVAKARGCKVIVTDHHLPGQSLPDADAIVNPNLAGDGFASKHLCGVGVMFYLLLALRSKLGRRADVDLVSLLDLVALGTVADLVALDRNNRRLVEAGLRRIRAGKACPGITALFEVSGRDARTASASDLGFSIGPRINAAGRLEDMTIGVECLLADEPALARQLAATLHDINAQRRDLQSSMVEEALAGLADVTADDAVGVSLFDPGWHHGIVGLVAARVKERLHRPIIAFAPAGDDSGMLRGSARSVSGFHIRDALAVVDARCPGLVERFGGHAMAAGLSLRLAQFPRFAEVFDVVVRERIAPEHLHAVLISDGELAPEDFDLELARQLRTAGPWGQGFPMPLFDNLFECVAQKPMGADGSHRRLQLRDSRNGCTLDAVRFHVDGDVPQGVPLRIAYELMVNDWQGRESLRLLVRHCETAD